MTLLSCSYSTLPNVLKPVGAICVKPSAETKYLHSFVTEKISRFLRVVSLCTLKSAITCISLV